MVEIWHAQNKNGLQNNLSLPEAPQESMLDVTTHQRLEEEAQIDNIWGLP